MSLPVLLLVREELEYFDSISILSCDSSITTAIQCEGCSTRLITATFIKQLH